MNPTVNALIMAVSGTPEDVARTGAQLMAELLQHGIEGVNVSTITAQETEDRPRKAEAAPKTETPKAETPLTDKVRKNLTGEEAQPTVVLKADELKALINKKLAEAKTASKDGDRTKMENCKQALKEIGLTAPKQLTKETYIPFLEALDRIEGGENA